MGCFEGISGLKMTSISAASTSSYLSPLDLLKKELQSEVSSGKISSTDQTALSTALDDIDSALKGGADSSGGSSSSSKSPGDLQSKIDDLISGEVSSGKLTSDQATELKNVFSNAFASGGPGGPGGPPPPSDSSDSSSSTDTTSSSSTSAADLLQQLLQALQNSLSQSSSSSYSANGNSNSSSSISSSLLVDFKS